MAWGTIGAGVAVLALAVLWYGLQVVALRDLRVRPRVRGDNKLLWAFAILCVPYVGALGYLSLGPTSFLSRPVRVARRARVSSRSRVARGAVASTRRAVRPESPPVPLRPVAPSNDPRVRPPTPRPAIATAHVRTPMAIDPVIGTDSNELLVRRSRTTPDRRSPDMIRWPGTPFPQTYQQPDSDLRE